MTIQHSKYSLIDMSSNKIIGRFKTLKAAKTRAQALMSEISPTEEDFTDHGFIIRREDLIVFKKLNAPFAL